MRKLLSILAMIHFSAMNCFTQPGSLDLTFDIGTGTNDYITALALQADGKIIIAGFFTSYNGVLRSGIARLNSDGSIDNSFNPGTGVSEHISKIAIQPDGKIIISGNFTSYNGTAINRIARLNSDGSLDNTFNPGTGANDYIFSCVIQTDNKILIGGSFTNINGTNRNKIARLNSDGSIDLSLDPGTGPSGSFVSVRNLSLQPDGKIIVAGIFENYNGSLQSSIARINTDGTNDNSFDPGDGAFGIVSPSGIFITALQSDGKIIIGGEFIGYDTEVRKRITRINSGGSLDGSFTSDADGSVNALALQPDGKTIICGDFSLYNQTARNFITRINSDGTIDNSFIGSGSNSSIDECILQPDGKILISGYFTNYNGTPRNYLARLNGDNITSIPSNGDVYEIYVYPNPTENKVIISNTHSGNYLQLHNTLGQLVFKKQATENTTQIDIQNYPAGVYTISITEGYNLIRKKIVKQ